MAKWFHLKYNYMNLLFKKDITGPTGKGYGVFLCAVGRESGVTGVPVTSGSAGLGVELSTSPARVDGYRCAGIVFSIGSGDGSRRQVAFPVVIAPVNSCR